MTGPRVPRLLRTDSEMESFLSDAETLLSITRPSVHTISKGNPVVYLIDLMATRVPSSHVTCILRQSGIRNRSGGCTSSPYSHHIRTRSHTRGWTHHTHSYYAYAGAIWLSLGFPAGNFRRLRRQGPGNFRSGQRHFHTIFRVGMVSLSCVASFKAFCNTNVTVSFPLFC